MELNQENQIIPGINSRRKKFIQWSGLGGVIGPILLVVMFTISGFLRPGYSAVRQTISDLGIGPMASLVDIPLVIVGLLMIALAAGFYWAIQPFTNQRWRWISAVLIALPGLGLVAAGIFTEAPETLLIHILFGAFLGLYFPVFTFLLVGRLLIRTQDWRGFGVYSLVASAVTFAAIAFMQVVFTPGSPLYGQHLGGLAERADFVIVLAWYVILGWRLIWLPKGEDHVRTS